RTLKCHVRKERSRIYLTGIEFGSSFAVWASSETESSQKLPEMLVGYTRPRWRQTEILTASVPGPVEKATFTGCHAVVPIVAWVDTLRHEVETGSRMRTRGPLSEVMSSERT